MISVNNDNGLIISVLDKMISINTSDNLRDEIKKTIIANPADEIKIDLEKVEFLDSSAIAMLVKLMQSLSGMHKRMSIINVNPTIKNTIRILNLTKFLNIQ